MENGITIMMGSPSEVGAGGGRVAKYGVGRKCRGKVVNFKPYGFFVETEDGGFGLVHGRNIRGWQWALRFDKVFRHGSEIEVEVVDIEEGTNRMSFACPMPAGYADEVEETPVESWDDLPPPPSRREVAEKWREENPEKSKAAYEWLSKELADGPLYGPLTNVLCDCFEVPVPVSQWILLFPDFTCYSGKGDNPSDLPAVALSARAGEVAYWDRIKVRTDDLLENRNRGDDSTFDVRIYGGAASSGKVALSVKCAPAGTPFASDAVEDVLGLYNRLGAPDPAMKVAWTNGVEWIVFTRELLLECIGVLAEHRGAKLAEAMDVKYFKRIVLPADATPAAFLTAFADLHDALV